MSNLPSNEKENLKQRRMKTYCKPALRMLANDDENENFVLENLLTSCQKYAIDGPRGKNIFTVN